MKTKEKAVRDAAKVLHDAIVDAQAAGFSIVLPRRVEELTRIIISETGRNAGEEPVKAPAKTSDKS